MTTAANLDCRSRLLVQCCFLVLTVGAFGTGCNRADDDAGRPGGTHRVVGGNGGGGSSGGTNGIGGDPSSDGGSGGAGGATGGKGGGGVSQPYAIGSSSQSFSGSTGSAGDLPVELFYPAQSAGIDVEVAAGEFPVVIFSHGYKQAYADYRYVWEELVPAGYIVLLPAKLSGEATITIAEYALDINFLIAKVVELNGDGSSSFHGHIAEAIALMGHSTGAGASFIAISNAVNNGWKQAVTTVALAPLGVTYWPIIGPPNPADVVHSAPAPVLILSGGEDCITPVNTHQDAIYAALPPTIIKAHGSIIQGDHCGFSDNDGPGLANCELGETFQCGLYPQGPTIAVLEQNELSIALFRSWLDHFVKGEAAAWTAFETASADPRLSFEQHIP